MSNNVGNLVRERMKTVANHEITEFFLTMFNIVSPLMVLLTLVGGNNGQQNFGTCDYVQELQPGQQYYVFNTNYPQNYPRGSSCRWIATADRPIKLTCNPFNLPTSDRCLRDALTIQDFGDATGRRYCGNGTFTVTSRTNQLSIILTTSLLSQTGRFLCTLETQTPGETVNDCRCGWKNPTRIVGGEETSINEYPMMSALIDAQLRLAFCGATIINERQVLTAGHCVATRDFNQIGVLVGDHDLSRGNETNATRLFRVDSIQLHPLYNAATTDYDVALVTISGTIVFSQQVGPVCLPFQHAPDTFAGNYVDVLGWGSTEFGNGPSNTLQKAQLSIITNARCRQNYPQVTSRQLCTQEPGKDSCQFDSGGPVLWQNPSTRRIVEVGVISFGSVCADGIPAVNSRVGAYMDWIISQTPQGITYCQIE